LKIDKGVCFTWFVAIVLDDEFRESLGSLEFFQEMEVNKRIWYF
jgi:hypothetical protein